MPDVVDSTRRPEPPPEPPRVLPELVLLLHSDPADAVAAAIMRNAQRFPMPVLAISLGELLDSMVMNPSWTWHERTLDPTRTAVVNRLVSFGSGSIAQRLSQRFQQQRLWTWLHAHLQSFAYVSSMPGSSSMLGGYGSLLDQWLDLPELAPGLHVPAHHTAWNRPPLHGDVCAVDPWHLYSLGKRLSPGVPAPEGATLVYARPAGVLIHVAQVGGSLLFGNTPPHMTQPQQAAIVSFTEAMRLQSPSRILEHAFFIGNDAPVFYSTCPVPVITGTLPHYPRLVVQGLLDDFARYRGRPAA